MVLFNASNRSRHIGSVIVQNQGGGDKKAGFAYQVGREHWTSMFIRATAPVSGKCCTKPDLSIPVVAMNTMRPVWARPGSFYGFPNIK